MGVVSLPPFFNSLYANYDRIVRICKLRLTDLLVMPRGELVHKAFPRCYDRIVPDYFPATIRNVRDIPYGDEIKFLDRLFQEWQEPPSEKLRFFSVGDIIVLKDGDVELVCCCAVEGWYVEPRFPPKALYEREVARVLGVLASLGQ